MPAFFSPGTRKRVEGNRSNAKTRPNPIPRELLPSRGNGITTLAPKRARGHARTRCGLATLELVEQHEANHAAHRVGMETLRGDFRLRLLAFDEARENRIQLVVRWQRILIGLVVAQFGGRRTINHGGRNSLRLAIARRV